MGKSLDNYGLWCEIIKTDATQYVKNIQNSLIIMNWPDYNSDFAYQIASNTHESNILLYIGEDYGGCTANDKFFEKFTVQSLDIPWYSWCAIHDRVYQVCK